MGFAGRVALAVAIALSAGAATANTVEKKIRVDDNFTKHDFGFIGHPGKYIYMWKPINIDGAPYLCGVGVFTDATVRNPIKQAIRNYRLKVNGQDVLRDITFFARVKRQRDLKPGSLANCARTKGPAFKNSDEIILGIDRGRVKG